MPVIFLATKGVVRMMQNGISYEQTGLPEIYKTSQERLESTVDILAASQ